MSYNNILLYYCKSIYGKEVKLSVGMTISSIPVRNRNSIKMKEMSLHCNDDYYITYPTKQRN